MNEDNDLSPVLAEVERSTHIDQVETDKIEMLPGLKSFHAGGTAVGDGGDGNDSDQSSYVSMTESENEEGDDGDE